MGLTAVKEALNSLLKLARSKPGMVLATTIVCGACVSPDICIACGILVAKIFG